MGFHLTAPYIIGLPFLGAGVGILATIVGLGGGFVMVPILLLLFPQGSPAAITSISLVAIFIQTASATGTNFRDRRIDLRTALLLLVGAGPAAVAGALVAGAISREMFETLFGALLVLGAVYIGWRAGHAVPVTAALNHNPNRLILERRGATWRFYVPEFLTMLISPLGGFVSGLFGIGGGVIFMPALVFLLKVPTRVATSTSLLVLVPTSFAAVLTHVVVGNFDEGWRRALLLGVGSLVGAQIGVRLASKVNQRVVLAILALGMAGVGIRQIVAGL